ncbi:MAG: hypothetical protein ACYDIB_06345 [Desulfobulbia bacterium]
MSNVLIIGAGASRAEAISCGLTGNNLPPLDNDFFDLAEEHGSTNHLDRVKNYLKDNYSIDIENGYRPRMEESFGLIYSDTLTEPIPKGAKLAFSALCRTYNKVIADTTNKIDINDNGPLVKLIKFLLTFGELDVITFNQDLVVERALCTIVGNDMKKIWYPDNGYSMNFSRITSPGDSPVSRLFEESNGNKTTIRVLKMHGSLNWYTRTLKKDTVPSKLTNTRSIYCTKRIKLASDMKYNAGKARGRQSWYTWPIIVPPIFEKGGFMGKVLSEVWTAAFEAIKNTENIFIYGYSFPVSDQQSEVFFRRATIANKIERDIYVVNPDFSATERANKVLQPSGFVSSSTVDHLMKIIESPTT